MVTELSTREFLAQLLRNTPYWDPARHPKAITDKSYDKTDVEPTGEGPVRKGWDYQVPLGRCAMIEMINISMLRTGAVSTGAGRVRALINIIYHGFKENQDFDIIERNFINSQVGAGIQDTIPAFLLLPGDRTTLQIQDKNGDGTVDYNITAKITEFDQVIRG